MNNCYLNIIKKMPIPQLHKDLIVGCGLGDGYFGLSANGKSHMTFEQGLVHKDYLLYLFGIMKEYATLGSVTERVIFDARYNKQNFSYRFRTRSSPIFHPFASLFLSKLETGKYEKIVPSCIEELVTPGALAF